MHFVFQNFLSECILEIKFFRAASLQVEKWKQICDFFIDVADSQKWLACRCGQSEGQIYDSCVFEHDVTVDKKGDCCFEVAYAKFFPHSVQIGFFILYI